MNSLQPQQDENALVIARFGRFAAVAIGVVIVAFVAACATLGSRGPEELVKERAQARWNALVQGDVKTAYQYFSPGSRATFTLADFAGGIKIGFWKAVTVEKVQCSGADSCDVSSSIEYEYRGTRVKSPQRETWVREDSNWWLLRR